MFALCGKAYEGSMQCLLSTPGREPLESEAPAWLPGRVFLIDRLCGPGRRGSSRREALAG